MSTFSIFLVLITIVCFFTNRGYHGAKPKGGGLSSSIGGSQMLGGVQKLLTFRQKYLDISNHINRINFVIIIKVFRNFSDNNSKNY